MPHAAHHDHDHAHGHHHHGPVSHDAAFAIGVAANTAFVIVEIIFGIAANSVALIADAMHNLSDVLGLLMAWVAAVLARRPPSARRTYGWGRLTILAALANGTLLMLALGAIGWEAVQRLRAPEEVAETTVIWVAAVGIVVNGATAALFVRGQADLNIRGAFLHMAADALVSLGVVLTALIVLHTSALWIDPLVSLAIVGIITAGTWGLLRQSTHLMMDSVPEAIDLSRVQEHLGALAGVREVHDLHIWALSTTETALTAHLVCNAPPPVGLLTQAVHMLAHDFAIHHSTIQIETEDEAEACRLRPENVV